MKFSSLPPLYVNNKTEKVVVKSALETKRIDREMIKIVEANRKLIEEHNKSLCAL